MTVSGYTYTPNRFTVVVGVPVVWQVDGGNAAGCGRVIVMPSLGISKYLLPQGITTITFTPTETGTIPFNCSMGMMTRGSEFIVVPNTAGIVGAKITEEPNAVAGGCDPKFANCIPAQQVFLEISRERGFYPPVQTIKKGIPVEFTVDDEIDLGGCMGTMTIPEYGVAQLLKIGKNVIRFTPTHTGTVNVVCSMGSFQTSFNVID
jgi:plastocyanin domain-containing protein